MGEFSFSIDYNGNKTDVLYATKISEKPETEDNQEPTFTETVSSFKVTGYTIDIDKIMVENFQQYKDLQDAMAVAESTGVQLTVYETKRAGDEEFVHSRTYFDCKGALETEGSPTDNTTGSISFKASRKEDNIQRI